MLEAIGDLIIVVSLKSVCCKAIDFVHAITDYGYPKARNGLNVLMSTEMT